MHVSSGFHPREEESFDGAPLSTVEVTPSPRKAPRKQQEGTLCTHFRKPEALGL